ncbi:hypothetical protein K432DRAFT_289434 [Lepidopterella palustris CBS 459.81]|uniref:Polyprenal reductase n=1 Tax=Lepidopterella palustris CBS 459.81 TaxID=1314670 RepID=A0A8E2EI25_9PEZI|nr:hypothetical protein K432DRAFT_289434 [Lepidopterella palustris CBS 459.81]
MAIVDFLIKLLDPVVLLRTFYIAAAALILFINTIPALRSRFLAYGSRATSPQPRSKNASSSPKTTSTPLLQFLDHLTIYRVPHNWFTHFYILSVLSTLFWTHQLYTRGPASNTSANPNTFTSPPTTSMSLFQVHLVLSFQFLQGLRRLLESHCYTSTSTSQMWIGHYMLGLLFYLTINIAIWIEGLPALLNPSSPPTSFSFLTPTLTLSLLLPLLLASHILQNNYHAYLFHLRTRTRFATTYTLPSQPPFSSLLCPHYTVEVLIYILLALLAIPPGQTLNLTLSTAAIFVAVNLGVTANGTKEWYLESFGAENVGRRKRIVPWVW